jgi:diadenosine tetraphosphate (Ap4A) HIT family hydrolase
MRMSSPNSCPGIFEKIYSGQIPGRLPYVNERHGIGVVMDIKPAAQGHLVVFPAACVPHMDSEDMPSTLSDKLFTVGKFAGRALRLAVPDAPYIGQLVAGNEVPHAHLHRVPGDPDADWLKRLGKVDGMPRLTQDPEETPRIYDALTSPDAQELWAECDARLDELGEPDQLTLCALMALGRNVATV